jgi:hypothetical protein
VIIFSYLGCAWKPRETEIRIEFEKLKIRKKHWDKYRKQLEDVRFIVTPS